MDHPTSALHVAHFVQRYLPALGGSEAYFARLADYLAGRGDVVTVFTSTAIGLAEMWRGSRERPPPTDEVPDPEPLKAGSTSPCLEGDGGLGSQGRVTVRRYPPLAFPGRRYVLKAASLVPVRRWQCLTTPSNPVCPRMWAAAGRFDGPLDAVHATAFPYSFPIACGLRLARRRRVPFLLTPFLHLGDPGDPTDRTRRQYTAPHLRWLLRQADRVFVQTRAEGDTAASLGVRPDRVALQGLGVEPSECTGGNRATARAAWGVESGEMVVGHLANASVEKGTVDLLDAAAQVWAKGRRFRVVLAGPGMPNFRTFWERFPHRDRVTRLGVLSAAEKRDFYAGIDAFALPSRSDSFGLVLLEAWANGKPNLVYRAGGPAELVRDGIDGLQARCGDVAELAARLSRLAADERLRDQLGEAGRERVGREFRWADKLELVRGEMTTGRRGPAGEAG